MKDKKGTENVAADHLSRLELKEAAGEEKFPINETFPYEQLMAIQVFPWYADMVNYLVSRILLAEMTYQQKKKFFSNLKYYF